MNGDQSVNKINFQELYEIALKSSKEPPFIADNLYVDLLLTVTVKEIQSRFDFVLKGGTAILKTNGRPYRFSYDLDFSYFPKSGKAREHYKWYKAPLERLVADLGYRVVQEETAGGGKSESMHREGGRIFILKLMDGAGYLKRPIKFSISSIDEGPYHAPVIKSFKTIVDIPEKKFGLLYPGLITSINQTQVKVLTPEELCAEKIRALATRGSSDEWRFLLRDAVDLYMMDQSGILDRVLAHDMPCIRQKFISIRKRSYWRKFEQFMATNQNITISEGDLAIFFDPQAIDVRKARYITGKLQRRLRLVYEEISGKRIKRKGILTQFLGLIGH